MQLLSKIPGNDMIITSWVREQAMQHAAGRWEMTASGPNNFMLPELVTRIDLYNDKLVTVIWCYSNAYFVRTRTSRPSQRPHVFTRVISVHPQTNMIYKCCQYSQGFPELDGVGRQYAPALAQGTVAIATILHWRRYNKSQVNLVNVPNSDIEILDVIVPAPAEESDDEEAGLEDTNTSNDTISESTAVPETGAADPKLNPANFNSASPPPPDTNTTEALIDPSTGLVPPTASANLNVASRTGWITHKGIIISTSPSKAEDKTPRKSSVGNRTSALHPLSPLITVSNCRATGRTSTSGLVSPSRQQEGFFPDSGDFIDAADAANRQRPACPNVSVSELLEPGRDIFASGGAEVPLGVPPMPADKKEELEKIRAEKNATLDNVISGSIKLEPVESKIEPVTPVASTPVSSPQEAPNKKPRSNAQPPCYTIIDSDEETPTAETGDNSSKTNDTSMQSIERVAIKEEPVPLDLSLSKDPLEVPEDDKVQPDTADPDDLIERLMSDDEDEFVNAVAMAESDFAASQLRLSESTEPNDEDKENYVPNDNIDAESRADPSE